MSPVKRMLGAAVFAIVSASAAQAAVITFEGQEGPAFNQQSFNEAGYNVAFVDPGAAAPPNTVLIGRFINGSDPASCSPSTCPTDNPTTYFDLLNNGFIDITANTPGATFRFSSLDASLIATPGRDLGLFPGALQVIGIRADQSQTAIQFNIPNALDFQTFNAADVDGGLAFSQEDFVEIAIVGFGCNRAGQCGGLNGTPGEIGLDNIVLSDLPDTGPGGQVPEPATLSLLAFGLMGMGARLRRRR